MIISVVVNKIKCLILLIVNLFRRALCCFKRRRRDSNSECEPLTHVVSGRDEESFQNWEWEENLAHKEPKTVQDHIELYRKQKTQAVKSKDWNELEEQLNFFEDMTPNITKQMKVVLNTNQHHETNQSSGNRLNFDENCVNAIITEELREWDESSGWENELLDHDAQKALREKKRQEREQRAWEQQQKRQEKMLRALGKKFPQEKPLPSSMYYPEVRH
ncbi:unnamed protein product [Callosobruchus maculatus]|uniref:Receptor-binding cancer antigen expressed on SiSo cells n=1 Tax=Callosobruchus maculatus TaxID=64391 RepID=A0A653BKE7_CALMS|nr:unnamed protein product [Callosobruchus maculatus]